MLPSRLSWLILLPCHLSRLILPPSLLCCLLLQEEARGVVSKTTIPRASVGEGPRESILIQTTTQQMNRRFSLQYLRGVEGVAGGVAGVEGVEVENLESY